MKLPLLRLAAASALALVSAAAVAQHGPHGSADTKPLPVAEKAAHVSFADDLKPDPELAAFFGDFAETMRTHDGKPFLPRLDDNFTIPGFPGKDMKAAFVQAMKMVSSPDAIVITAIEPGDEGTWRVKTDFKFPKRTARREFVLSAKNRLVSTTLIAMRRVPAGEQPRGH